jgi:arsenate reductase
MLFVCYSKCGTCKKAQKHLDELGKEYVIRDIKMENPTRVELESWWKMSHLPLRKMFNTSGKLYKEMDLKNKLVSMSDEEMLDLLASDGMLVKRPILVVESKVLVGYKQEEYDCL